MMEFGSDSVCNVRAGSLVIHDPTGAKRVDRDKASFTEERSERTSYYLR
jgi:hypothetical protein